MWRHCEAYVKAKQIREEPMAFGCLDLKLDHFAARLNGLAKISTDVLEMCNSSINKIKAAQPAISLVIISRLSFPSL